MAINNEVEVVFEEMVAGLAKPGDEIIAELTPAKAHLWHMATGVMGEVVELIEPLLMMGGEEPIDFQNIIEELGDIEFYLEGLRQGFNLKREDIPEKLQVNEHGNIGFACLGLVKESGDLLDQIKKIVIYNKPIIAKDILLKFVEIEYWLTYIRDTLSIARGVTIDENILKLGVRYKGHEYSNEQAQLRADKKLNQTINKVTIMSDYKPEVGKECEFSQANGIWIEDDVWTETDPVDAVAEDLSYWSD